MKIVLFTPPSSTVFEGSEHHRIWDFLKEKILIATPSRKEFNEEETIDGEEIFDEYFEDDGKDEEDQKLPIYISNFLAANDDNKINKGDIIKFGGGIDKVFMISRILKPIENIESSKIKYLNVFLSDTVPEHYKQKIISLPSEKFDLIIDFNDEEDFVFEDETTPFENKDVIARFPLGLSNVESIEDLSREGILDLSYQIDEYFSIVKEFENVYISPFDKTKSDFLFAKFSRQDMSLMKNFVNERNICCGEIIFTS